MARCWESLLRRISMFSDRRIALDGMRWPRLVRQFGGLAKVDRVRFYAANCSVISAIA
jgi:hypothetical protein